MIDLSVILSLDIGSDRVRAILFDTNKTPIHTVEKLVAGKTRPTKRTEPTALALWDATLSACFLALTRASELGRPILAIGLTTQPDALIVWNRRTGDVLHSSINHAFFRACRTESPLADNEIRSLVKNRTGQAASLSSTGAKLSRFFLGTFDERSCHRDEIAAGTLDTWILWKLTGGELHSTDVSNAARTQLLNVDSLAWDQDLLAAFNIPANILPEVQASDEFIGMTHKPSIGARLPICANLSHHNASLVAQNCTSAGCVNIAFDDLSTMMINLGADPQHTDKRLDLTAAYSLNNQVHYAYDHCIGVDTTIERLLKDAQLVNIHSARAAQAAQESFYKLNSRVAMPGRCTSFNEFTFVPNSVNASLETEGYRALTLLYSLISSGEDISLLTISGELASQQWLIDYLSSTLVTQLHVASQQYTDAAGVAIVAGVKTGLYDRLSFSRQHAANRELVTPIHQRTLNNPTSLRH